MNESIRHKTGISDALVGFFGPHPLTQEASLMVDLAWSYSDERRDFCMLEKLDCSSKADTVETSSESVNKLECPDFNKNRHCGKIRHANSMTMPFLFNLRGWLKQGLICWLVTKLD